MMTREQMSLRIGAVCVVVGSVVVLVFRTFLHGDLPTDTGEAAPSYVASHPLYSLVHLGGWLGVLVWAGGLVALSGSLTHRAAWAVAWERRVCSWARRSTSLNAPLTATPCRRSPKRGRLRRHRNERIWSSAPVWRSWRSAARPRSRQSSCGARFSSCTGWR
jgi:hypothetical protein